MKKANTQYFLYDDDRFDYAPLVEPTSQAAMQGYKAVAWNTNLNMTGWWQGRNVIGMTTDDKLFDMGKGDISQTVQIQTTWKAGAQMPWTWEPAQGVNDKMTIAADVAMPVSFGNNLRQAVLGYRMEDVSAIQAGTDHGQRIWLQFATFDSQNVKRPMEIYFDPYTSFRDIVVTLQIRKGEYSQFFDFSKSANVQQNAYDSLLHFEVTQSRQQFSNLLSHVENVLGVDLQNETGYHSMIQALVSPEMATFPQGAPQFGIGHFGAQQMAIMNFQVYDV